MVYWDLVVNTPLEPFLLAHFSSITSNATLKLQENKYLFISVNKQAITMQILVLIRALVLKMELLIRYNGLICRKSTFSGTQAFHQYLLEVEIKGELQEQVLLLPFNLTINFRAFLIRELR